MDQAKAADDGNQMERKPAKEPPRLVRLPPTIPPFHRPPTATRTARRDRVEVATAETKRSRGARDMIGCPAWTCPLRLDCPHRRAHQTLHLLGRAFHLSTCLPLPSLTVVQEGPSRLLHVRDGHAAVDVTRAPAMKRRQSSGEARPDRHWEASSLPQQPSHHARLLSSCPSPHTTTTTSLIGSWAVR